MADQETKDANETTGEVEEGALDTTDEEQVFVEDPSFEIDYKGECAYEVKVTIPAANRGKQATEMFDELKHEAEVPGFRKGRAPRKLVERKFGKHVRAEVETKLVSAAFEKLIKDNELRPLKMPDVDGLDKDEEKSDDEPVVCTFKFEVAPKVELGKYRGIDVERPVVKIEDSDVDQAVEDTRMRYATFEDIDGAAADGDQIIIDFKGLVDGNEFPGGSASDYPYIVGTKRFFPEFEEVLNGASPGDELACTVSLPEDAPNEDIRGKKAEFTITVKGVKRRQAPELDDEFAKKSGFEGVDDMRQKVRERLSEGSANQSNQVAESRALEAVIQAGTYEIPKSLIEGVAKDNYDEEVRRLLQARVPVAQLEAREDDLRARSEELAVAEIKRLVTLNEIGEAEDIEVTEEDFEQEVSSIAARTGMDIDAVGGYFAEDDRRSSTESRLFRAKALRVIMDSANVTDKELSREELDQESESSDPGDEEE
jgi:trigger factor